MFDIIYRHFLTLFFKLRFFFTHYLRLCIICKISVNNSEINIKTHRYTVIGTYMITAWNEIIHVIMQYERVDLQSIAEWKHVATGSSGGSSKMW